MVFLEVYGLSLFRSIFEDLKYSDVWVSKCHYLDQFHTKVCEYGHLEQSREEAAHQRAVIRVTFEIEVNSGAKAVTLSYPLTDFHIYFQIILT